MGNWTTRRTTRTLPVLINPANGTKSYDKGNIIQPLWQLKWSCAILSVLCKDVTSLCASVRTHVFCVRQWSLGISTGSKTKQTLRTYKWAYKTYMLKMQTILSNTKQCYIKISLNIRKRVKDIISARTSSRFRVEVSEIWGLETWVYESRGFEVFDGSCPLWKCWMEFGWQFNSFIIPAFLKNSFRETPNQIHQPRMKQQTCCSAHIISGLFISQEISHFLLFQYQFLGDLHMNFVDI
jgi:hypothetical protein